ncbi:methyltransferase domain-containing protein [Desulfonatronum thioautotrophicum]|uniref:methyltransferase domain-containing protein n=1 Tax=Desulfonatronum thioautotrophicum TaxID=617001 RepID=UPI000A022C91|nr:methyltransferase domain-containing protein [Desulfonatronum thioautotrophicum]
MADTFIRRHPGYCPICEMETIFFAKKDWLRDHYFCARCKSIPRFRALVRALEKFIPNWRSLTMHESSPGGASSEYLRNQNQNYTRSHYLKDIPVGMFSKKHDAWSENLEAMTYPDESFDIFITQDVMEHTMRPLETFREIARVLKPGGAHIFTVPWYPDETCSRLRAEIVSGELRLLAPPQYHGNPIDKNGSLVTVDWGIDLPQKIFQSSELHTTVFLERDIFYGLDGEFLEVFVSQKM